MPPGSAAVESVRVRVGVRLGLDLRFRVRVRVRVMVNIEGLGVRVYRRRCSWVCLPSHPYFFLSK